MRAERVRTQRRTLAGRPADIRIARLVRVAVRIVELRWIIYPVAAQDITAENVDNPRIVRIRTLILLFR